MTKGSANVGVSDYSDNGGGDGEGNLTTDVKRRKPKYGARHRAERAVARSMMRLWLYRAKQGSIGAPGRYTGFR